MNNECIGSIVLVYCRITLILGSPSFPGFLVPSICAVRVPHPHTHHVLSSGLLLIAFKKMRGAGLQSQMYTKRIFVLFLWISLTYRKCDLLTQPKVLEREKRKVQITLFFGISKMTFLVIEDRHSLKGFKFFSWSESVAVHLRGWIKFQHTSPYLADRFSNLCILNPCV